MNEPAKKVYRISGECQNDELFQILFNAVAREAILRRQMRKPDQWLEDCVRWAGNGCSNQ